MRQRLTAKTCKLGTRSLHIVYMLPKLASISRWAKISLLIGFVLAASVSACDSTRIDTIWGELDSVRADVCMDYTGLYNHVLVARRGFDCGLGTTKQLPPSHWCGCECRWYDIWRKIEQIDTVEVAGPVGRAPDSIKTPTIIDWVATGVLGAAFPFHGDTLLPEHDTAREYMHVDTVECCPGLGTYLVRFRNLPGWECWCIPENSLIITQPCTIRYDTTWHPKVQFTVDTVIDTSVSRSDTTHIIGGPHFSVRTICLVSERIDTTWFPIPVSIWIKDSTVDILE